MALSPPSQQQQQTLSLLTMMKMLMGNLPLLVLVLLLVLSPTLGYPQYQTAIPNGNRVPHPCVQGQAWLGVGHVVPAGGGDRNPFGRDFAAHGMKWTPELCHADSDGDGRSNGQELGDPQCTWREGMTPDLQAPISHPGVCEPITSADCTQRNAWMKCTSGTFECDAFQDKELRNLTLRLPAATPVPAEETTYSCMLFRVPDDASFHLVATQPFLDNTMVVHHMLLFGCRNGETMEESSSPYRCEMVPHANCQEVIITWTIGMRGNCLHPHTGFRLGQKGYRMVALQVHWNNPNRASDYTDSSGLVVHYTPTLRQYDAGVLVFGHLYLQVDPQNQEVSGGNSSVPGLQTYSSLCPSHCLTRMFNSTIYITSAINHMHYLGKHQRIELVRKGEKVLDLAWDPQFVYDSPVVHRKHPPVAMHPGDEIRTTCTFRRPRAGRPVCYGEATSDEMCFGFLTYFPKEPQLLQPWCTSRRSMISCERTIPELWNKPIYGCPWRAFIRPPSQEAVAMVTQVLGTCYSSSRELVCSSTCRAVLRKIRQHPCFVGDMGYYVVSKVRQYSKHGEAFANAWFTCNCDKDYDFCERRSLAGVLGKDKDTLCQPSWAGAITDGSPSGSSGGSGGSSSSSSSGGGSGVFLRQRARLFVMVVVVTCLCLCLIGWCCDDGVLSLLLL
ncbi:uncharacterized protein LOC143289580 [Babylonia areolata]|uniref:uncharacterized protein LOC143289580 n=1 Tax=Babylonia areolata TaxID=304850 RepID=UPI003FD12B07